MERNWINADDIAESCLAGIDEISRMLVEKKCHVRFELEFDLFPHTIIGVGSTGKIMAASDLGFWIQLDERDDALESDNQILVDFKFFLDCCSVSWGEK